MFRRQKCNQATVTVTADEPGKQAQACDPDEDAQGPVNDGYGPGRKPSAGLSAPR